MATLGRYTKLLIDQFNFSGASNQLTVNPNVNPLDTTCFQQAAMTYIAGLSAGNIGHSGYYNGKGAGLLEQELAARLGTGTPVYVAGIFGTNGTAPPAYVLDASWGQNLVINAPVAELITVAGEWPANDGMRRGRVVYDGALSATGATTSLDFGAAGSTGGVAFVFVQSITGTATGADIDIESSATEGGTYASEGTATFSALGVVEVALTGTVNRWIRLNVTDLGGATAFTVVAIVCINGVTQ